MPRVQSSQTVELRAAGLYLSPNRLRLPPGALVKAENVTIQAPGRIDRARGFRRLAAASPLPAPARVLTPYAESRIAQSDDQIWVYDSVDDEWDLLGDADEPSYRSSFLEAAGSLFFTTEAGTFILPSLTTDVNRAGMPKGLDDTLTLTGDGSTGFFSPDGIVAYRHTFRRDNAQELLVQGPASEPRRIANPLNADLTATRVATTATVTQTAHGYSDGDTIQVIASDDLDAIPLGSYVINLVNANTYEITVPNAGGLTITISVGKVFNVQHVISLPSEDLLAGDVLEVFRTTESADEDTSPGDDMRLVHSRILTTGDLTARTYTFTDDSLFLKENLYSNPGFGAQPNERPPHCRFLANFQGHTFFFYPTQPAFFKFQLIETALFVAGTSSITIGAQTYTAETVEDVAAREFEISANPVFALAIQETAESMQRVVNRDATGTVWLHYISGEEDAPGIMLAIARHPTNLFTTLVNHNGTTGASFDPPLTTTGTVSDQDVKPHGAFRSKNDQPEHVPLGSFNIFGRRNAAVLGVIALKTALLVFKEDGVFSLSGQSDGNEGFDFVITQYDPTVILDGPRTLAVLDNAAFAYTNQGLLRLQPGLEPSAIDDPAIHTILTRNAEHDDFQDLAFTIPYDAESQLWFFAPTLLSDPFPRLAWVWDSTTPSWTQRLRNAGAGFVDPVTNTLLLADPVTGDVYEERKTQDPGNVDYIEESDTVALTSISPITFSTASLPPLPIAPGATLTQGVRTSRIETITDLGGDMISVTLEDATGFIVGDATIDWPVLMEVEWAPITCDSPATLKRFTFAQMYFHAPGGTHVWGFQSDLLPTITFLDAVFIPPAVGWGLEPWGEFPWGEDRPANNPPLRTLIPLSHQYARALSIVYKNSIAREFISILCLATDFDGISSRTEFTPL